ncbi:alpha/beta fold hydrolase [Actinoplanes sp. NPDC026619]|uniref:alpha/beta fold hydrolase n=1 Tax=Actinoplanes sp. NPDC026619 TaxID=3155798 RepID=UPI0033CBCB69
MDQAPEVRYARTGDGVTIGYQQFGAGASMVWLPSLSNIVAQWRVPALRSAYEALARRMTVTLYDGRGTGSSDRRIDMRDLGVEAHLRDLVAVLDDAGLQRVSLLGYYHSVPTAIAFAARHPERVERLVLFGGAPRLRDAMRPAQTQALLSLVDQDWSLFADAAATAWLGWDKAPSGRWTAESFRTATTAPFARAWFDAAERVDVTGELGQVRAPTLVLHRQGAGQIPVEVSQRLAGGLPGARFVELPGSTPTLFIENQATDLELITDFVTGSADTTPTGGTPAPAHGTTAPAGGTAAPDVGTAPSAHGTTASAHGTTASAHGTTASAHGTTASAHGTTASAHGTMAPAGGTAARAHGTTASGRGTTAPGATTAGPGGSRSLTPRETEVLQLLATGDSNIEIAGRLGIAVHTVERHLANLYRKIGARGRTDAVAYAWREIAENRHTT